MASILIPPNTPTPASSPEDRQGAVWGGPDAPLDLTPHLLLQLEDDLERSRMREAFWISVVVHMAVVIFLFMSPKIFPGIKGIVLISPEDLMRNTQATFLELPPDVQKEPKVAPKTDVLSDKNRIAESRHPQIDKKTLEELKRAGPPRPTPQAPSPQPQMAQQSAQPAPRQQNPAQGQQTAQLQPAMPQDNPRLPSPQQSAPKFPTSMAGAMSPGASINQALQGAAASRLGGSYSMGGGDYGAGPGGSAHVQGNLEVLSDTQGVDFGPYLQRVLDAVRRNWYTLIPEAARAPLLKKGKVAIDFAIMPDGKIAGMTLRGPSGDVSLDRAAWGGITASNPFAPLPGEFHGPYLALRFRFFYNPGKGELE
jgi:outer membrane biosynthesis protein TonB